MDDHPVVRNDVPRNSCGKSSSGERRTDFHRVLYRDYMKTQNTQKKTKR